MPSTPGPPRPRCPRHALTLLLTAASLLTSACENDDGRKTEETVIPDAAVAKDAPTTPSMITSIDASQAPDVTPDVAAVPDARALADAAVDAPSLFPMGIPFECDPIHDPCGDGFRCTYDCTPPLTFRCTPDDIGTSQPGDRCERVGCVRGSECDNFIEIADAATYRACFQFCFRDSDCPAGHPCDGVSVVCPGAPQLTPYGHCS